MINIAIVLCGGSGSRLGAEVPKQFLKINNTEVLLYSLKKFEQSDFIDGIIVVSHKDYIKKTQDLCSNLKKVLCIVEGGSRRQDSVFNGLEWIKNYKPECKLVFIHDSARPLFTTELLERLYKKAKNHGSAIPALPVTDTIKEFYEDRLVNNVDRAILKKVQTPQVFEFDLIYKANKKLQKNIEATDDAFILQKTEHDVYWVQGEDINIKITHKSDVELAEFYIKKLNTRGE